MCLGHRIGADIDWRLMPSSFGKAARPGCTIDCCIAYPMAFGDWNDSP